MFNREPSTEAVKWEDVQIIDAYSEKEKQAIFRFRYQIQINEMGRSIPGTDHLKKRITDALDHRSHLVYAAISGHVVGTARVTVGSAADFPEEFGKVFQLDRFGRYSPASKNICFATKLAVAPKFRKTPLFFRIMVKIYEVMRQHNVQFSFGGCNPYLIPMYEHMGYRQFAAGFQDPGYGFVVPVLFLTEDMEHLAAVRSPYLRIARKLPNSPAAKNWVSANCPEFLRYPVSLLAGEDDWWQYVAGLLGFSPLDIAILQHLTPEEAAKVLQAGTTVRCPGGDTLVRKGDVCNELYILVAGAMEVKSGNESYKAKPGDRLGAVGLLGQAHHDVDVTAITDCEVLAISRFQFEKLLRSMPELAGKFSRLEKTEGV